MKITGIETVAVAIPYRRNHTLSTGALHGAHSLLLRLRTDAGIEGLGEASIPGGPGWSEEFVGSVKAVCEQYLAPAVIGLDPRQPTKVGDAMRAAVRGNAFARAAIEMACFDVAGKSLSVPAAQLLGGARRDRIPMVWSLAAGRAEAEIDEAEAMFDRFGISTFKVKVGHGSPQSDLVRVKAITSRLAGRFEIRLDANQGWDEVTAQRLIPQLADIGVSLLEQPLPRWNLKGMARLTSMRLLPIMADESAMEPHDVANVIREEAASMLALKLAKAGGMLPTLQSALIADAYGLPYYLGCMMDTGLGIAAYLQTAAALPDMRHGAALPGPLLMADDILEEPVRYADGHVHVPAGAGLGIAVNWQKVQSYAA